MNISKKKCELCAENESKYKCPQCLVLYCSLGCYKPHKEKCVKKEIPKIIEEDPANNETNSSENKSPIKLVDYDDEIKSNTSLDFKNIESDFISIDKLRLLENSVELKEILRNKHLRELLINLNNTETDTIDDKMDKAMQEPLFQEFSDACLKIVQNETELEKV
ncbi:unnamed protein product [Brachionus calyciflorus]|uniref:Zinc finger HIT domain-containing protein 3 n=1 Tax=Brachionus calyciflorus TaxID=104777 RepID=A0A814ALK1_9BILA|nr:unnamed protein product [Brachionus calyciflorus]